MLQTEYISTIRHGGRTYFPSLFLLSTVSALTKHNRKEKGLVVASMLLVRAAITLPIGKTIQTREFAKVHGTVWTHAYTLLDSHQGMGVFHKKE